MTIALEGTPVHANASSGASIACPAFTTTQAAEVFIATTLNAAAGASISSISGGGLTWAKRAAIAHLATETIELWAAQASSALSAVSFTVNFANAASFVTVDVFAFSGQDTSTIWDSNATIPATAVSRPVTYSTNNANDVIISCFRMTATASPTAGTGFTKISGANFQLVEYKINSATETNATADTGSSAASNGAIADALMQAATVPVADFSGTPLSGTTPLSVVFTDASTNTPTSWAWTFGDGGTSTAQNPSHIYSSAGTYNVGLTATNSGGSNLATKNAYITVADVVVATTAPSGGIVDLGRHRRVKTKEDLAAEREKFGIPDEARIAIETAARRQALALENDEQKRFEELSRELTLRGLEWDVRYLEAMNTLREKLIAEEIGKRMKAKQDEEDVQWLLQAVAEIA